jgi:uncharacterized protein YjiS (DUF1127 family)
MSRRQTRHSRQRRAPLPTLPALAQSSAQWAKVPFAVAKRLLVRSGPMGCYIAHALKCDYKTRVSALSQACIAEWMEVSVRTVRRYEAKLAALGFITRTRLRRGRTVTLHEGSADASMTSMADAQLAAIPPEQRTPSWPPIQREQQNPSQEWPTPEEWEAQNNRARELLAETSDAQLAAVGLTREKARQAPALFLPDLQRACACAA